MTDLSQILTNDRHEAAHRPARRTTLAIRAEEAYSPDEHAVDYRDVAAWRLRNDIPEPPDPWAPTETSSHVA